MWWVVFGKKTRVDTGIVELVLCDVNERIECMKEEMKRTSYIYNDDDGTLKWEAA